MRELRGASQILYGFLPEQTVDLKGGVWKVDKWLDPVRLHVDPDALRRRLLSSIDLWRHVGSDGGTYAEVEGGCELELLSLNVERGLEVKRYPKIWVCKSCRRIGGNEEARCRCGANVWGQFHFIGFHSCGWLGEPWIPRCPEHSEAMVNAPSSSNVGDLVFTCPVCRRELMRGLRAGRKCPGCGKQGVSYNVHRAASVYMPHSFTMVNPPRPDQVRELTAAGGAVRCLDWALTGMVEDRPVDGVQTMAAFVATLMSQGLPETAARAAAEAAAGSGGYDFASDVALGDTDLLGPRFERAREEAFDIALAVHNGRRRARNPTTFTMSGSERAVRPPTSTDGLDRTGLTDIDLVDRFPVLRAVFGYTRGSGQATSNRLVMYRGRRGGRRIYGDLSETEALYFRLDPLKTCEWLRARGLLGATPGSQSEARRLLVEEVTIPRRTDEFPTPTIGSSVLTLVHTLSHRTIRQLSVLSGIDRESLAEYLVPHHLGYFVYAASRSDFVMGGLQAVFESDLDLLLDRLLNAESRCPLDPGCSRGGSACPACLHLGEPSCTHYNRFLDRRTLFGSSGFFAAR